LGVYANTVNQATVNLLRLQCNISRLATWSRVFTGRFGWSQIVASPLVSSKILVLKLTALESACDRARANVFELKTTMDYSIDSIWTISLC